MEVIKDMMMELFNDNKKKYNNIYFCDVIQKTQCMYRYLSIFRFLHFSHFLGSEKYRKATIIFSVYEPIWTKPTCTSINATRAANPMMLPGWLLYAMKMRWCQVSATRHKHCGRNNNVL